MSLKNIFPFSCLTDIITHLIPLINHSHPDVSHPVFQAIVSVFETDVSGQVTVEIMRLMAKLV